MCPIAYMFEFTVACAPFSIARAALHLQRMASRHLQHPEHHHCTTRPRLSCHVCTLTQARAHPRLRLHWYSCELRAHSTACVRCACAARAGLGGRCGVAAIERPLICLITLLQLLLLLTLHFSFHVHQLSCAR